MQRVVDVAPNMVTPVKNQHLPTMVMQNPRDGAARQAGAYDEIVHGSQHSTQHAPFPDPATKGVRSRIPRSSIRLNRRIYSRSCGIIGDRKSTRLNSSHLGISD